MLRRPCIAAGCTALALPRRSRCADHYSERQAAKRHRRASAPGDGAASRWRYRLNRQGAGSCRSCGLVFSAARLQIDHRVPLIDGGHDIEGNLQVLCLGCHEEKTTREAARRRQAR